MSYSYEVYVGNLSTAVTTEQLKDLFSQVGQVLNVWIKTSFDEITYGFVKFDNIISAEDACKQFDKFKLDITNITVRISDRTENQLKLKSKNPQHNDDDNNDNSNGNRSDNNKGILLELSKRTKRSNSFSIKKALVKDLRKNKDIIKDFEIACVEMERITCHDAPEITKTAPEVTNVETLTETIKRYYKRPCQKDNWQVDIDLSKGKRLTAEENDKFFNLKLTKPRPCAKPKKENYFSLDYRSINDV